MESNEHMVASLPPELIAQWHPSKNGYLGVDQVTPGSGRKAWWLGPCGHEWQAIISNRVRGATCPYCAGKRILPGYNDFRTIHPAVAAEWDYSRNGDLDPGAIASHSRKVAWWIGAECGHKWDSSINDRSAGNGCPYCSGKRVLPGFNDIPPEIALDWDPSLNNGLQASEVARWSNKKFNWKGRHCGHIWEATPGKRARGDGCPTCSGRRTLAGYNDLATLRPDVAATWHPTKNGDVTPSDVTVSNGGTYWWLCEKGHEWQTRVATRSDGIGCPVCDGKQTLKGYNDLLSKRPDVAAEWDYSKNGLLKPDMVTPYSAKRVWWLGKPCGHSWDSTVSFRSTTSLNCPYCIGKRVLVGFNDLATEHPELVPQWSATRNGSLLPTDVTSGSNKKVWWVCENGHEWKAAVATRSKGIGCLACREPWSKAEKQVYGLVCEALPETVIYENFRGGFIGRMELDVYVESLQLAVEFNGDYWHDETHFPSAKNRHERKQALCDSASVRLVIVWESDWNDRQDEVKSELANIIRGGPIPNWMTYQRG